MYAKEYYFFKSHKGKYGGQIANCPNHTFPLDKDSDSILWQENLIRIQSNIGSNEWNLVSKSWETLKANFPEKPLASQSLRATQHNLTLLIWR